MQDPYRFGQASGMKPLSPKPYSFGQASTPQVQPEPEEDLQPANEGFFSWLGNTSLSAAKQIGYGARDLLQLPGTGAQPFGVGQRLWDAISSEHSAVRRLAEPLFIEDKEGNKTPNPNNPLTSRLAKKMANPQDQEQPDIGLVEATKQQFGQFINDPIKYTEDIGKGLADQMLIQPLTAISGMKQTGDGGVNPATPDEQYQAIVNTTATAAMIGVMGGVSGKLIGKMGTTPVRAGRLIRAVGAETAGMVAGGVAGSLVKDEEVTLKSAAEMVLSPASLMFTALGTRSKYKMLGKQQTNIEINRFIQSINTANELAASKTLAANIKSTPEELLASITSLAKNDDLVRAAIGMKLDVGTGYLVPYLDEAGYAALRAHYTYDSSAKNPAPDLEIGRLSSRPIKGKVFMSNFDQAAFRYGASTSEKVKAKLMEEIKAATGLDEAAIISHANYMQAVVKDGKPNEFGKVVTPAQAFKPFFGREDKLPYLYRGPNGEVYVAPNPITKAAQVHFEKTGFFPEEVVSVDGKDVILKKYNPTMSIVDYGYGDKRVKTSRIVRKLNDELTTSITSIGDPANPMAPKPAIQLGVLTPESIMNKIYGEFRASLDGEYDSFAENLFYHLNKNGIPKADYARVQQYFYKKLDIENFATHAPEEQYIIKDAIAGLEAIHDGAIKSKYNEAIAAAHSNGFYFNIDANGYSLSDVQTGKQIGRFGSLDQIIEFSNRTGQGETVYMDGGGTGKGDPAIALTPPELPRLTAVQFKIGNSWVPSRKQIEFFDQATGTTGIGAQIQHMIGEAQDKYNSFLNHEAYGLSKKHEAIMKLGLSPEENINVARLQAARGLEELRTDVTPEQAKFAADLAARVDISEVQKVIIAKLNPSIPFDEWVKFKKPDANVMKIADELMALGNAGEINHSVMRLATAIQHPEAALSSSQLRVELMKSGQFTPKVAEAWKLSQAFFKESASIFHIPEEDMINNYLPTILDYNNVTKNLSNKWIKNAELNPEFVHELTRAGWTPNEWATHDIESIVHKYLVTGARVASGMSGEINKALKMKGEWVKRLQFSDDPVMRTHSATIDESINKWVESIKGVPESGESSAKAVSKTPNRATAIAMDFFTAAYLSARPYMAFLDLASTYSISTRMYGYPLFIRMANVVKNPVEFNRAVAELEAKGKVPQFTSGAILSRPEGEVTAVSKAADLGLKLSGQEVAYKVSYGSTYLATREAVRDAIGTSNGSVAKIYDKLGDTLLGNNPSTIRAFKNYIAGGQYKAAEELLAATNAAMVANRFGKTANPLNWQTANGRVRGQFGSWAANATYGQIETYRNKDWAYIGRAARRQAISMGVVSAAGLALGFNVKKAIVAPWTTLPGYGPVQTTYEQIIKIGNSLGDFSADNLESVKNSLLNTAKSIGEPIFVKNAIDSYEYWTQRDEKWKAFLKLMAFPPID